MFFVYPRKIRTTVAGLENYEPCAKAISANKMGKGCTQANASVWRQKPNMARTQAHPVNASSSARADTDPLHSNVLPSGDKVDQSLKNLVRVIARAAAIQALRATTAFDSGDTGLQ